ncbi:response regulator [Foetidibacter luteolus]|uniref:response regulator n=1 Tax=Foetidibacter luteolus TaxID=2608880 RepID=UPI00129BE917|nr:response regulator transcription factor [Foetidibacter luteolus]
MTGKKYIAIVDDHDLFRKGLAVLINSFPGYEVLFGAANGKDFINQLNPYRLPDIALLDISMPEMDGYETAEWLQGHYRQVNILALSTMDTITAIVKMLKNGAKGYLLKDAEPAELKKALDEAILHEYVYNDLVTPGLIEAIQHSGN